MAEIIRIRGAASSRAEAAEIFGAMARGVAHCHAVGVMHLNLSADNILSDSLRPLVLRICDFGTGHVPRATGPASPPAENPPDRLRYH